MADLGEMGLSRAELVWSVSRLCFFFFSVFLFVLRANTSENTFLSFLCHQENQLGSKFGRTRISRLCSALKS